MKRFPLISTFLFSLLFIVAGCTNVNEVENEASQQPITEVTNDRTTLPSFLEESPGDIKRIYAAVAQFQDELEQVPSYGSEESAYSCFIVSDHSNANSIEWTDTAVNNATCLDIAAYAILELEKGTALEEINKVIASQYGNK